MKAIFTSLLAFLVVPLSVIAEPWKMDFVTKDEWEAASTSVSRLSPDAFPALPPAVAEDLNRRGCTIPQSVYPAEPNNVISGHFQDPTSTDWAVLCSRNWNSTILVYWGGSADNVGELGCLSADRSWLQGGSGDSIEFSRLIATAEIETLNHYRGELLNPGGPKFEHEGVVEAFLDKFSTIYYWHDGEWHEIDGAD